MDLGDTTLKLNRYVGGITEVHTPQGNELCRGRTICFFEEAVKNRSCVAAGFLPDTVTVNVHHLSVKDERAGEPGYRKLRRVATGSQPLLLQAVTRRTREGEETDHRRQRVLSEHPGRETKQAEERRRRALGLEASLAPGPMTGIPTPDTYSCVTARHRKCVW